MQNELGVAAPIVFPDSGELGDKRLDPKENVTKLTQEIKDWRAKHHAVPEQKLLTNELMSLGHPLGYREFTAKLKKLNPSLIIHDGGYPNALAVRIPRKDENGKVTPVYVSGFEKIVLSEYDTAKLDQWGVAERPVRGWRSVLMMLIEQGVTTKRDCDRIFGEALDQRNILWNRKIQAKELK